MLVTIYDSYGNKRADISPEDSSTQSKQIGADNVLALSFYHYDCIAFDVNDYTDFEGERYWLTEKYRPDQQQNRKWRYELRMYGIESLIGRFLVLNDADDGDPVFSLTAPARDHLSLIVRSINNGFGNDRFMVGDCVASGNITIDYTGKYCDASLVELAEKTGTEYWFDGEHVNLSRCEHGEVLDLEYGQGVTSITPSKADNVKFYTRLYPIGSSRNIVASDYGHARLQLPGGAKYVDNENAAKYGIIHHFEQDAFSEIFPRRVGTVSSVRSEEVTDSEGRAYTIYHFKDTSLPFDPNDYNIGEVMRVSFQEGSELYGLGVNDDHYFECNYDSDEGEFEIITAWPYGDGTQLPGGLLVPKVGDRYVLWNIRMPSSYYPAAEQEFQQAVQRYNQEHTVDISLYKCPTNYIWVRQNHVELSVGRRVRLISNKYFPDEGYKLSRITRITRRVNLPEMVDLEISDALSRTGRQSINDSIDDVRNYVERSALSFPDVIKTGESKVFSDYNVLSALRSIRMFLRKDIQDTLAEGMKFDREIKSVDYSRNASGVSIYKNENNWNLDIDNVNVRKKLIAHNVQIDEEYYVGGIQWVTPGFGLDISRVEETETGYKCYFLTREQGTQKKVKCMFRVDDLARCQSFNVVRQEDGTYGNRYFWRRVLEVNAGVDGQGNELDEGYVLLSKTDCDDNSDAPKAEDEIVQLGSKSLREEDLYRKSAICLDSTTDGGSTIRQYRGINDYHLPEPTLSLNYNENIIQGRFISTAYGPLDTFLNGLSSQVEAIVNNIDEIKEQTDSQFVIWYGTGVPTLSNAPASTWDPSEYAEHEQDLYFDTSVAAASGGGRVYRFTKNGNVYSWVEVTDADTIHALEVAGDAQTKANNAQTTANNAQTTANSKIRCFVSQPVPPYDVGDLWYGATNANLNFDNETLVCTTAKTASQQFNWNDWSPATKNKITEASIQNLGDRITAFATAVGYNETTHQWTMDTSSLLLRAEMAQLMTGNYVMNAQGQVVYNEGAGLVTSSRMATMFAENQTVRAQIAAWVANDVSGATIQADQIELIGHVIIQDENDNPTWEVDEYGNSTFNNIIANGIIGGAFQHLTATLIDYTDPQTGVEYEWYWYTVPLLNMRVTSGNIYLESDSEYDHGPTTVGNLTIQPLPVYIELPQSVPGAEFFIYNDNTTASVGIRNTCLKGSRNIAPQSAVKAKFIDSTVGFIIEKVTYNA